MERRFRVIQGGAAKPGGWEGEGPISRLDLWSRTQPISPKVLTFMIFAKLAMLASVVYFIWGR